MRTLIQRIAPFLAAAVLVTLTAPTARAQDDTPTDAISRELTLLVPADETVSDAISRELTLWTPTPDVISDANAREVTLWVPTPDEPTDAVAREFTSYVPPYEPPEALAALRIAAGFLVATPADAARLSVVLTGPSPDPVTLEDAARILRLALRLEP